MVKAFISYSWDSEDHKKWVREFATRLRGDGIDVSLDQWDVIPGDQIPEYMERAVRDSDYVLIICTHRYKTKSNMREGGVGYEGDIMTAEVMTRKNDRKFIAVLRESDRNESAPSWLLGKYYIDLSSSPYSEHNYDDLLNTLLGTRIQAPPIGKAREDKESASVIHKTKPVKKNSVFEPIKILRIIEDQVGVPRDDGTSGSALYKVPFRLSRRPPIDWADMFVHFWNHPSSYTTMHRPGIASVANNTVILDGTTLEEVEKYHRSTLVSSVEAANKEYKNFIENRNLEKEQEQKRVEEHRKNIEDISKRISFDDGE